jgi:C-terminal processing protease CtpA/Prc
MVKRYSFPVLFVSAFLLFTSCFEDDKNAGDPRANFEALWKLIDEHYCFFTYKAIDWNEVYDKYDARITSSMDEYELFNELGKMLAELEDGHTNLISSFNTSRFWNWYDGYPDNFNPVVHESYLGSKYTNGLKYVVMRDQIGYVYYGNFSDPLDETDLDEMFSYLKDCKALIIDIRENTGGSLDNSERIAARFLEEKMTVGYIRHKTGPGHHELSEPYPVDLQPSGRMKWLRPVAVLTNRKCYSTSNDFVNKMKLFPQVTVIGDTTGGGCGLPFHSEIPNGWSVRFSSSPMLTADKKLTEYGSDPDLKVDIKESDQLNNIDTIIETALDYLKKQSENRSPLITETAYM